MSGGGRPRDGRRERSRYDPIGRISRREADSSIVDHNDSKEDHVDEDVYAGFIKVSRNEEIGRLAGKIAWNARRGEDTPLIASGPPAITNAAFAIADARRFLGKDEEPIELLCQPAVRSESRGASLAIYFSTTKQRKHDLFHDKTEFTVSKTSKAATVAGAIAARAREGIGPIVSAIGDEAICNTLMAISKARQYLEDDKLDVRFVATRGTIEKAGNDGNVSVVDAANFKIYVEQVDE